MISTIVWVGISKVKISPQCNKDICGGLGISLAISSNFFIFPGAMLYLFCIRYETYTLYKNINSDNAETQRFKSTCQTPRKDIKEKEDTNSLRPNTPATPYKDHNLITSNSS